MENSWCVYIIGFLAQALFSARILCQWILSERAKKVLSPSIFWILSIMASYLLCIYGWLRDDFAIIVGQFISYYIYIWNLKEKEIWKPIPLILRVVLVLTPVVALIALIQNYETFIQAFFYNEEVPLALLIFGTIGQITFTLRFIYQWLYSRKEGKSILPPGFWIISLIGSTMIIIYGIIRQDPVLILGQSVGIVAYVRNLFIGYKQSKITIL